VSDTSAKPVRATGGRVDHPDLGNIVRRIERHPHAEVECQARVCHLDDQHDVGRPRVGRAVEILPRLEDPDVGLRLAHIIEGEGILHPEQCDSSDARLEKLRDRTHERCVHAADGRHVDDLSVDQFDPVLGRENPRLAHPPVVGHGEAMPRRS
jgi:hypothetical protein